MDGHKFTGNFAPINQILGLFKYGRKGIPAFEKLNEAIDPEAKRKIVLYAGRFQPMGRHHAEVFKALQQQYGSDSVYVVTSNKVSPPKSPLNFEEKKEIMLKHGIPDSQIIQAVSPYRIGELADQFDAEGDVIIYAVGRKDMDESPRFKNLDGKKRDGNPTYLRSYDKNKDSLEPFENHAYVAVAPHVSIKLPNGEEMSGSTLRDAMKNLTPESFKEAMGWFDKEIYEMLRSKINESVTSLSETILSIVEEVLNERFEKESCTKKGDKKGQKGNCVVTTSRGESCYNNCQQAYAAVELEELRVDSGKSGSSAGPKKCPKCDLDQKNQPCLCGKYNEPALQDDYESESNDEFELEEISAMGISAVSVGMGGGVSNKKRKRKFK